MTEVISTEEARKVLADLRKKKVQSAIEEKAERAVQVTHDILESEDAPPVVRLNAAKDILDRAGFKPVEKQVVAVTYPKPIIDINGDV